MKFTHSLQSEWIKTKNSAVIGLTVGGALFVPVILIISRILKHNDTLLVNSSGGVWLKLFQQNWQFMSVFLLPMGIILASSLLIQIEYRNNTWKQLYTTPQKLSTIFWAKYSIILIVLLQFFLLFNVGVYLSAVVPSLVYSDVPYPSDSFPLKEYLMGNANYFLYCLPIVALQYLLSLHIKNFVVTIGIGLGLVVTSLIAVSNQYGYVVPYIYADMKFLIADNRTDATINISYWALGYFLYFSLANYLIYICKTQTKISRFFKLKSLLFALSSALVVGVILIIYIHTLSNKKTVKDHSQQEIEQNIKIVENNLGAFKLENNTEWTLAERMKFYKVKGVSIAVIHNYKIEWAKGYGFANEDEKIPVTTNTLFEPGSLSKSVHALAIMQMVQEGKINLFADINQYLHTWKFPYDSVSKGRKITLLNLLSHTAGLGVHGFEGYKKGDSLPTIQQILNGTAPANSRAVRSVFEPNKKMEYSGGGTMISQILLMDVSYKNYDNYLDEHILQPLQMNNSSYTQPLPENKVSLAAIGYDSLGVALSFKYPIMVEQAACGLWTTPTDMCKFIIELQKSLMGKSNKILTQKNAELMLTPYMDERVALGFFIDDSKGYRYFSHQANNRGFSGVFYGSFKDGNGLAVFINSENDKIVKEIGLSIIDTYDWNGFDQKEKINVASVADSSLIKFTGMYKAKAENRKVAILKENNSYYCVTGNQKMKMYFTSKTAFINMENPTKNTFEFDNNNNIKGFKIKYKDRELFFAKIN